MAGIRKILIVEDIRFNQALLTDILGPKFEIELAGDGLEGVQKALLSPPDLIFMDISLPLMDGFEATRRIREKLGSGTRIVALSANSDAEHRAKARIAGMDDYLEKPFSAKAVFDLVNRMNGPLPGPSRIASVPPAP